MLASCALMLPDHHGNDPQRYTGLLFESGGVKCPDSKCGLLGYSKELVQSAGLSSHLHVRSANAKITIIN